MFDRIDIDLNCMDHEHLKVAMKEFIELHSWAAKVRFL